MSTAANFPLTACETLNFRLQKLLLFLVRKILAQKLIAEINLYGAISRMRLPEMDHWLCSTICMLNPLEQKIFARAVSLKSHRFLNSNKKTGGKGQQWETWMWNHASSRGDSPSLLCKAGNVPHFLLKHIVSNRRGPDGCYFNPKLMDLGRFSYKGFKKLLILSLVQRGFRRTRQTLNCKPGTEVLFAQDLPKSPLCPFSKVLFPLFFLSFKQGRFWACQQEWSPCICCNITKGTNSPDLGIYILPPQSQPTCFSLTQDLFMLRSWLLHSSEELLFLIQEIPNNTETMSLHLDYNIYKGMGMFF